MSRNALLLLVVMIACALPGPPASAEPPAAASGFKAPPEWKQERIQLPPPFARKMRVKGIEQLWFAPGMYRRDSQSFFSYMFRFDVLAEPELDQETLTAEFLAYYRGLAPAVGRGKDFKMDPAKFELELKAGPLPDRFAKVPGAGFFQGDLKWVEPFVTGKPQTLHLELLVWKTAGAKPGQALYACVSPAATDAAIWKQMRKVRANLKPR